MSSENNALFAGIIKEAEDKGERIIQKSLKEAEEILKEAEARASKEVLIERNNTSIRLEAIRLKEESIERNITRSLALKRSDNAYNAVMDYYSSHEEAFLSDDKKREEILISWICEASYGLGKDKALVSYSKAYPVSLDMLKKAQDILKEKLDFDIELSLHQASLLSFGVTLSSLDGKVTYNNTIENRMKRKSRFIKQIIQEVK